MRTLEQTIAIAIGERNQWRRFYRAVRILRQIRMLNPMMFLRFSGVWWQGSYKHEQWLGAQGLPAHQRKLLKQPRRLP